MARYTATVRSPWPAEKAFAFMADLRNFEKWDPSVSYSKLISGSAPGPDAVYDVKVMATVLRYTTPEYDEPHRAVAEARTKLLRSYDIIEVTATETGCDVFYDATFELNGALGLANPLVKLFFNRIGDRAAAGMVKALDGTKIA
jgi:ribosome-associated toxin RatA of RatAB toxin-antitoxin module